MKKITKILLLIIINVCLTACGVKAGVDNLKEFNKEVLNRNQNIFSEKDEDGFYVTNGNYTFDDDKYCYFIYINLDRNEEWFSVVKKEIKGEHNFVEVSESTWFNMTDDLSVISVISYKQNNKSTTCRLDEQTNYCDDSEMNEIKKAVKEIKHLGSYLVDDMNKYLK